MQMRMTYLSATNKDLSPGSSADTIDPDAGVVTTELDSKLYNGHLNDMCSKGWQLISVQPVHRIEYTHIQNISVISGFYFFWQKSNTNVDDLAFPMTAASFPGFPATNSPAPEVIKANPTPQITAQPTPAKAATTVQKSSSDLSFCETRIETYKHLDSDSTDNKGKIQETESKPEVENRVSKIKRLLAEKSSTKSNKSIEPKPEPINIPAEANTQLLRNLEDFHNLKRIAKSKKPKPEQKSKNYAPKPKTQLDTDDHLDLDLDFDFDDLENSGTDLLT